MKVLVTGGAGYIGSHTVKQLLARGHDVCVVDNLSVGHREAVPADRLIVADLDQTHILDQIMTARQIEAVVHFAAWTYVGESVEHPAKYYRNNIVNTLNLLECLRRHDVRRFVFSSTAATYGVPEQTPITEDHPQRPINPYGQTKFAVECALRDYAHAYGWGAVALRYFNAAGAAGDGSIGEDHTPETHAIPLVIQCALGQRAHFAVYGTDYPTPDGSCVRDFVHVDDLASAHVLALERLEPKRFTAFNLGIGRGYSVREVVQSVENVSGRKVSVRDAPRRLGDPPSLVANSDKIRKVLGWSPQYGDLRSIVETAWKWHVAHPNGYRS